MGEEVQEMRAKYAHPFETCKTCKKLFGGGGVVKWGQLREHLHDLHDPMTSCIYCKRLYGVEWDHYCTHDDLAYYHFTYEDWEQSFEK